MELQKISIQVLLKFCLIQIAHRNIDFPKHDTAVFYRFNSVKVDNKGAVYPHKPGIR